MLQNAYARRGLLAALVLLSCLLIQHHASEVAAVLREGVAEAKLTLDFRTYMCGSANLAQPYDICQNGEFVSGFVYPPPSIIYFHALSQLPIDAAFLLHSLVAFACLAATAWMVVRMTPVSRGAAFGALAAALAIAPIGTSFAAGQVNVIVMTTAVAAIYLASHSRLASAGLAVASGFWLKLYPGITPVLFLTRRKWPAIFATGAIVVLMAIASLLWSEPRLYLQYFIDLLPHAQGYTMPGVAYSLAGIAAHIEAGGGAPIIHFVAIPTAISIASKALLVIGVVAALTHQYWTQDKQPLDTLNILLVTALVSAPNAWGYHYALIFPVLFSVLARHLDKPGPALLPILGCWLALIVPGWTDPPALIADNPALNVLFRGRYALVAVYLAGTILTEAWRHSANRQTIKPLPLAAPHA